MADRTCKRDLDPITFPEKSVAFNVSTSPVNSGSNVVFGRSGIVNRKDDYRGGITWPVMIAAVAAANAGLVVAGTVSSMIAGWLTGRKGRRFTIVLGGCLSIIGIILQIATWQLHQYDTDWNWRVAFALAGGPALIMTLGTAVLTDSPSGLIERGFRAKGRAVLVNIRGTEDVEAEFLDTKEAAEVSPKIENPWKTICTKPFLPQLIIAIFMPLGQQLPGIDSVMFYSPQIFHSLGLIAETALLNAVIVSGVQWACTLVAVATEDHFGRRPLLIEGGSQVAVALIAIGAVLASTAGTTSVTVADAVLFLLCLMVSGFAWSWGPLGWLVPTEVQPLESRSAGMAITTSVSLLITFLNGQAFPAMLCGMEFGVFLYFAGWIIFFTLFVIFFLPETKNVPLEEVEELFFTHLICWGKMLAGVKAEKDLFRTPHAIESGNGLDDSAQVQASLRT